MKKTSSLLLIFLGFILFSCSGFDSLKVPASGSAEQSTPLILVKKDFELSARHDRRYLHLVVRLKDPDLIRDAEEFGLILFYSDDKNMRYKYGFSHPSGLYNGLSFDPKLQRNYLQQRTIRFDPSLAGSFERAKEMSKQSVVLYQQAEPQGKMVAIPMIMQQVQVQSVELVYQDDRRQPEWQMRFPISNDVNSSFGVQPLKGKTLFMGLAIKPPNSSDIVHQHFAASAFRELDQEMGVGGVRDQYRQQRLMQSPLDWEYWFRITLE